ncbi:hypothetical protein C8Q80DRAFT_1267771 [Daedaleopsis nitida]|nr:hypothetical protein C8Q80DRAFT_1267771 [Daedaleopsis nitida]
MRYYIPRRTRGPIYLPDEDGTVGSAGTSNRHLWPRILGYGFLSALIFSLIYILRTGAFDMHSDHPRPTVYKYSPSQCSEFANWTTTFDYTSLPLPYTSRTRLVLSSSRELFFVSEGILHDGSFDVVLDDQVEPGQFIVDFEASYRHPEVINNATVCVMHSSETAWGVGIFTPLQRPPYVHDLETAMAFDVRLRLPAVPLSIRNMTTDMPGFLHSLSDLRSVHFEHLEVRRTGAPILVEYVAGDRISMRTTNADIGGRFNVSTSLDLQTSGAPIRVSAALVNDGGEPTDLRLKTCDAGIGGVVSLVSTTQDNTGGTFGVIAHTSMFPLDLEFLGGPRHSSVYLDARASHSEVRSRVKLHDDFASVIRRPPRSRDVPASLACSMDAR